MKSTAYIKKRRHKDLQKLNRLRRWKDLLLPEHAKKIFAKAWGEDNKKRRGRYKEK